MRFLALAALIAVNAFAQNVYEWEDAEGLHYTDDVTRIPKQKKVQGRVIDARPASAGLSAPKVPVVAIGPNTESKSTEYEWRDRFITARRRIETIRQSQAALQASLPPRIECVPQPVTLSGTATAPASRPPERCQLNLLHDQLMVQIAQQGVELRSAEADLDQLERRASMEAVPREWRRGW